VSSDCPKGVAQARRFVIVGLSRLSVRVARSLSGPDVELVVIALRGEQELRGQVEGLARVIEAPSDLEGGLREAGVEGATCLLALSEDDLRNLDAAVGAKFLAPEVPVVLRAFDPSLADQLEGLNVRRAYSVSALSAPAFVAAALADEVVETLRLGAEDVTLLRLTIHPGSPLLGKTAAEIKVATGCAVVARAGEGSTWRPAGLDERFERPEERVLVGGLLRNVLGLAVRNGGFLEEKGRFRPLVALRRYRSRSRNHQKDTTPPRRRSLRTTTLLPVAAAILVVLLLATVLVFALVLDLGPVDAAYFAISTALGNATLDEQDSWLKVIGVVSMLMGGALLGVAFSWLAALATSQRLEQRMGRRARELSGHAIVLGLGTIGYRVEQLLRDLGIPTAAVDRDPDPRFRDAMSERTPVLTGDVRLPENLERAGVRDARWLIACTADDLTNIESCLSGRRLNPSIRTVARMFDGELAERIGGSLGIDAAISTSAVAAGAFVGAASDQRAFRSFRVGDAEYLAFRYEADRTVDLQEFERWRGSHVRILAFRRGDGPARPASELSEPLQAGDSAILAGPAVAIRSEILGEAIGQQEARVSPDG
jgi:Trk K+ transport system NAD-binding subunit